MSLSNEVPVKLCTHTATRKTWWSDLLKSHLFGSYLQINFLSKRQKLCFHMKHISIEGHCFFRPYIYLFPSTVLMKLSFGKPTLRNHQAKQWLVNDFSDSCISSNYKMTILICTAQTQHNQNYPHKNLTRYT